MFTGLVSDVGTITGIQDTNGLRRLTVESRYPASALEMGASVMHSGACLTIVEFGTRDGGSWWVVEAVPETLQRTVLGEWGEGARTNLELSLKMGDELGGHLVSGHVDAVGEVLSVKADGDSRRIRVSLPGELAAMVAEKGSIAIDGTSLTVSAVSKTGEKTPWFEVAVIPHTLAVTTLGDLEVGNRVNLEVDMIARYVARMLEARK